MTTNEKFWVLPDPTKLTETILQSNFSKSTIFSEEILNITSLGIVGQITDKNFCHSKKVIPSKNILERIQNFKKRYLYSNIFADSEDFKMFIFKPKLSFLNENNKNDN